MAEPLLTVRNLVKSYTVARHSVFGPSPKVMAVNDVSFQLQAGETLGIVGESGCGKSTLGKSILRLIEPTSGEVFLNHRSLQSLRSAELRELRREMQIVFQDPFASLNPRMKIRDILAEPFRIHKLSGANEIEAQVRQLLEKVGLGEEALSKRPHEFSGGQRQRIGIARAIALKPKLVVADEPVSALDVSIQAQILNLLTDLRRDLGLSFLFIAHDLAVVEHISHRIAVMYLGRIVEICATDELFSRPLHPYTRALVASVPNIDGRKPTETLKGDVPSPVNPPPGCAFHTRCPLAQARCRTEAPVLRDMKVHGGEHLVACHFA
jgi:oligopeptide transport system ATP-binding protein